MDLQVLAGGPWAGWFTPTEREAPAGFEGLWINGPENRLVVQEGDVIRVVGGQSRVSVLFRRGASSNFLFATERCDNLCLMCSQPPREVDDSWRVREMVQVVNLVDRTEEYLGITGGEPTLLGDGLFTVLKACRVYLPDTKIHILTNGRRFADLEFTQAAALVHDQVTWAIPLYGEVADAHDFVVQAQGAFDQTIRGLHNLARTGQNVEIRVVLHRQTIERLGELVRFIYRNLSFARHVALMGLEPIGFSRANRELVWIDPMDYQRELLEATYFLATRGMRVSIYNLPFCVLPKDLWNFARQSISQWKNTEQTRRAPA